MPLSDSLYSNPPPLPENFTSPSSTSYSLSSIYKSSLPSSIQSSSPFYPFSSYNHSSLYSLTVPPGTVYAFAKLESLHPSVPSYYLRCLKIILGKPNALDECDIDLSSVEPCISPKQVTIHFQFSNHSFELTMHADTGVCINNQPLQKNMTVTLKHRTQISIGLVRFLFLLPQPTHPDEVYRSYLTTEEDLIEAPPFDLMIRETLECAPNGMTLKALCKAMIKKYPQTRLHCGWQHSIHKLLQRNFKKLPRDEITKEELWGLP